VVGIQRFSMEFQADPGGQQAQSWGAEDVAVVVVVPEVKVQQSRDVAQPPVVLPSHPVPFHIATVPTLFQVFINGSVNHFSLQN
jgi:hypothetical protein